MTLRPFGPSVTFTASARRLTPRSMPPRASALNLTSFAAMSSVLQRRSEEIWDRSRRRKFQHLEAAAGFEKKWNYFLRTGGGARKDGLSTVDGFLFCLGFLASRLLFF